MNPARSTALEEIALCVRDRLSDVSPREFVVIGRHKSGELCFPASSSTGVVDFFSGPIGAKSAEEFAPLFDSEGRRARLDITPGANVQLPPVCFAAHVLAIVGDAPAVVTLRLRG